MCRLSGCNPNPNEVSTSKIHYRKIMEGGRTSISLTVPTARAQKYWSYQLSHLSIQSTSQDYCKTERARRSSSNKGHTGASLPVSDFPVGVYCA